MPGLQFTLGRVLGIIAGIFKFRKSKNNQKRTVEFSDKFEKLFNEQFQSSSELCVQSKLRSSKNKKDESEQIIALVRELKKKSCIKDLDWFNFDPVMVSCITPSQKHWELLITTSKSHCCGKKISEETTSTCCVCIIHVKKCFAE